ncbi:SH2 domain [Trinorchestia longiramus]|nr:SH2 domain [Trinorchestia longiramus]
MNAKNVLASNSRSDRHDGMRNIGGRLSVPCPSGPSPYSQYTVNKKLFVPDPVQLIRDSWHTPPVVQSCSSDNVATPNLPQNVSSASSANSEGHAFLDHEASFRDISTTKVLASPNSLSVATCAHNVEDLVHYDAAGSKLADEIDLSWMKNTDTSFTGSNMCCECHGGANTVLDSWTVNKPFEMKTIPEFQCSSNSFLYGKNHCKDDVACVNTPQRPVRLDMRVLDETLASIAVTEARSSTSDTISLQNADHHTVVPKRSVSSRDHLLHISNSNVRHDFHCSTDTSASTPTSELRAESVAEEKYIPRRKYSLGSAGSSESFESSSSSIFLDQNSCVAGIQLETTMPTMEFVWETDANGGKKVSFLVGADGEPTVVVLGAPHVDSLLQERARCQMEEEEPLIKSAADEELDRLVRMSRSTVQQMEEDNILRQKRGKDNPARAAVVRSLQEATMEMELQIRELEEKDPVPSQGVTEAVNEKHVNSTESVIPSPVNQAKSTFLADCVVGLNEKECKKFEDPGPISSCESKEPAPNLAVHTNVCSSVAPPTPPPSPPAEESGHVDAVSQFLQKPSLSAPHSSVEDKVPSTQAPKSLSSSVQFTNSVNSAKSSGKLDTKLGTNNSTALHFSIQPYGTSNTNSPAKKIQTKVWEPSPAKPVITTCTKPNIFVAKPAVNDAKPVIRSSSTVVTSSKVKSTINCISHQSSTEDKSQKANVTKFNKNEISASKSIAVPANNGRSFSGLMFGKSSKSSTSPTYVPEEQPSPPPVDEVFKRRSLTEKLARNSSRAAITGVSDQIRRFESLSEGSLEALKTATLERARKKRQAEILEHLRHQVELAKKQAEKNDEVWLETERRAKQAEARIREIARRAREEHRRQSFRSQDGRPILKAKETKSLPLPDATGLANGTEQNESTLKSNMNDINGNPTHTEASTTASRCEDRRSQSADEANLGTGVRRIRPLKPPSRDAIIAWFRDEELAKGAGLEDSRQAVAPWFHGIISRTEAEQILAGAKTGSFLVRVSERIWGYAISYRAMDRCRHYLIDVTGGKYTFLGSQQPPHDSLSKFPLPLYSLTR